MKSGKRRMGRYLKRKARASEKGAIDEGLAHLKIDEDLIEEECWEEFDNYFEDMLMSELEEVK